MDVHFQLNVLTKVLQAVCGCLSALTVYTHMLHLERWCVCSHRKWRHWLEMSCPLPKSSEVGGFFSFTACLAATLFSYSWLTVWPSPPTIFSAVLPTQVQRKDLWFSSGHDGYSLSTDFLFSLHFSIYLQPPSVWPDPRCTLQHASPHFKSPAFRTRLWSSN